MELTLLVAIDLSRQNGYRSSACRTVGVSEIGVDTDTSRVREA